MKTLFLDRGWQVFSPEGETSEVDCVVYHRISRQLYRVQVKSGGHKKDHQTKRNGNQVKRSWRAVLSKNRGSRAQYLKYDGSDFDLLCVVDRRTDRVYVIEWPQFCEQLGRVPAAIGIDGLEQGHRADQWQGFAKAEAADAAFSSKVPTNGHAVRRGPQQLRFDFEVVN